MRKSILASGITLLIVLLSGVSFGEEKEQARKRELSGELTKVGMGHITITRRGDSGESSSDAELTDATKILFETDEVEETHGEGGKVKQVHKLREGTADELVVGQRVAAVVDADGKALKVLVKKEPSKRKEGREG